MGSLMTRLKLLETSVSLQVYVGANAGEVGTTTEYKREGAMSPSI